MIDSDISAHPAAPRDKSHLSPAHWLFGLFSLFLRSGSELTRVVGEMHHTWRDTPLPWDKHHQADLSKAPKPYLLVKLVLEHASNQVHKALEHVPVEPVSQPLHRVRSAMNGVFGDKLKEWDHPLSQTMLWVDEHGHDVHMPTLQAESERGVVVFIHGLCLSESDWQGAENRGFVAGLRKQGFGVVWLRYNSGLPIWENGAALAQLLESAWSCESGKDLRLLGHSMGGLLIRSACHVARQSDQHWLDSLSHAAYLASPHDGAPMEKIGNMANSILGVTPYARPLMALGNIRSQGIRSLRHANVTEPHDDTQQQMVLPFYDGCEHLLIGARKFYEPGQRWLGDGLVPEDSAMGGPHFPEHHPSVTRNMLDNTGHITLLKDGRLYELLREWLS